MARRGIERSSRDSLAPTLLKRSRRRSFAWPSRGKWPTSLLRARYIAATEQPVTEPGVPSHQPDAIVWVVDDDESVREGLGDLLRSAGLTARLFASAQDFLACPRIDAPGCLVLDVRLPGLSGLELQQQMAEISLRIPIVFITGYGDVPTSVRAMKAGAIEFLTKPFNERDLLESIQQAISRDREARQHQAEFMELHGRYESLTPREREVMGWVVSGALNKQAAAELGIREITVKFHRAQVMHKMQAGSLADLVRMSGKLQIPPADKWSAV